ncbi:hypothetical protein DFP72DRAFT_877472 [Ephemerocybe angulata]|uniref:Uncharacterized protein n=1 Tax=Ephemerocybe angulata TaxID=980116 RepID=A0A8H6IDQ3_9AGAR|nr:hypothetical protein DFP72DRAFT_877472 [Tulosesus angulatus]
MKSTVVSAVLAAALASQVHAYIPTAEGALNVRHFHVVERALNGEIVDRNFVNTYEDLDARSCTSVLACGTAGGCMAMAAQRYCDGVPWQKSFQDAVRQTGANGKMALKLVGESLGRSPLGGAVSLAKNAAMEVVKANKEKKEREKKSDAGKHKKAPKQAPHKKQKKQKKKPNKHKRDLSEEKTIMNRRDFEIVERDERMNLVKRSQYSTFDLVMRNEDGNTVSRACEMSNGDVSCM